MNSLLLLLGGSSTRFGGSIPKQFFYIQNEPLFTLSCSKILENIPLAEVVLVVKEEYLTHPTFLNGLEKLKLIFPQVHFHTTAGGKTRHMSFRRGMEKLKDASSKIARVLVHDASRPFLRESFLKRVFLFLEKLSEEKPCFIPVLPIVDSVCKLNPSCQVLSYEKREELFRIQTPQLLYAPIAYKLFEKDIDYEDFPDEGSFFNYFGLPVFTFLGDEENKKITFAEDLKNANKDSDWTRI